MKSASLNFSYESRTANTGPVRSSALLEFLARGHNQLSELVLVHKAVSVSVGLRQQLILLGARERITAMQRVADLVEEELRLILLEEIIAVPVHGHPQLIELRGIHVVGEAAEVPEQDGEGNLHGGSELTNLLLSRQRALSLERARLASEAGASTQVDGAAIAVNVISRAAASVNVHLALHAGGASPVGQLNLLRVGVRCIEIGLSINSTSVSIDIGAGSGGNIMLSIRVERGWFDFFGMDVGATTNSIITAGVDLGASTANKLSISVVVAAASGVAGVNGATKLGGGDALNIDAGIVSSIAKSVSGLLFFLLLARECLLELQLPLLKFFHLDSVLGDLYLIVLVLSLLGVDRATEAKHAYDDEDSDDEHDHLIERIDFREMDAQRVHRVPMHELNGPEKQEHTDDCKPVERRVLVDGPVVLLATADDTHPALVLGRCLECSLPDVCHFISFIF